VKLYGHSPPVKLLGNGQVKLQRLPTAFVQPHLRKSSIASLQYSGGTMLPVVGGNKYL